MFRYKQYPFYLAVLLSLLSLNSCGGDAKTTLDNNTLIPNVGIMVNQPKAYPVELSEKILVCDVDVSKKLGPVNKGVFGTNLEWFNEAGGLASKDTVLKAKLVELTKQQGASVMRFPGGILADYYHWKDGIGPAHKRPRLKHPTDSGSSENVFGSPEFFQFLKDTNSEGLITVNAGTASAEEAADWVKYANEPNHPLRMADGFNAPIGIKYWEVGNELYYPGNPDEVKIGLSPAVYADRYLAFAKAIRKADANAKVIAIGVAKSHIGPDTEYPDWTEILLKKAASEIDMIAVHNAYFPFLYKEKQPPVELVYPALLASPEAVDRSLVALEQLIKKYETSRKIGIAITEWGALFSLPNLDNYWVDHVKTMGSGVYVARLLQVMMNHPRVEVANYFKLTDRSFMGWINFKGEPKVPYWVVALFANHSGTERVYSRLESPVYKAVSIGTMVEETNVPEVTVVSTYDLNKQKVFINLVNRSLKTAYPIKIRLAEDLKPKQGKLWQIQTKELTAHNGRDIPPEWPYHKDYEPYSTAAENSIKINELSVDVNQPVVIAPFSVATIELDLAN